MNRPHKDVTLIGAPADAGAGRRGAAMGPEALRVAGIAAALRRLGCDVEDTGNLSGPVTPDAERNGPYRHLKQVAAWCRTVYTAVGRSLSNGRLPILMGGDHSLSVGSIAAVAEHCAALDRPLFILWLDAHADFNTDRTSPSGNLHGMPVSIMTGQGPDELMSLCRLRPMVSPERIVQVGVRSVDQPEKQRLVDSGLTVFDMRLVDELSMRAVMEQALREASSVLAHLHVSLDVDFLDPQIAPGVPTTVPGGPTYREAQLCMEMIHDSGLLASLDIMELNPAWDLRNTTAELVVELVESLFGEQILARESSVPSRYSL